MGLNFRVAIGIQWSRDFDAKGQHTLWWVGAQRCAQHQRHAFRMQRP